ncbi:F-box only protein 22 [Thalassophryne amazonica]|uniref:F-box only protein 22 n=1 Tax=Thalassophryne amazonica TaxID=390379 RepID=UPI001471D9DF|nr:F-box only protein 22 [Thalassophryne amazonica]
MGENKDFSVSLQESKVAYILSNVAEVVEKILTFVPTKSLLRIASVCRLWRNCARRVLRTQQQLAWVSASGPSNNDLHVLCSILAQEVENVFLLPKTVLTMVDSESFNGQAYCYRQSKATKCRHSPDTVEELTMLFPKGCDIMGVATPGIILTPSGSCSTPPQEYQEGEAGYAIMFPSMEGVNIRPFHFCKNSFSQTALKEAGLVDNPELRVVLIFVYEAFKSGGAHFLNQILEPLAQSKALTAGGLVESVFSPSRQCCSQGAYGAVGLAFSGAKVQGASVLLDQDISSSKAAEATIRRLKAAKIPERNTLGFMFACVGRGQNYYSNQSNVEADAFRKVFPNTPLFGLFGNGEIGCDRIVKDDYTLCDTDSDGLQHQYTTVMTLVHLG